MTKNSYIIILFVLLFNQSRAQIEVTPLDIELQSFMTGLSNPVDIAFLNGTMFRKRPTICLENPLA